jgi:segregation and condensation protein A
MSTAHDQHNGRATPQLPFLGGTASAEPFEDISFQLHEFEGPLDLLLHLIQRAEVNVYDIPIAEITDQYLRYVASAAARGGDPKRRLEHLTQFHVMAATLLHIKSRMLLPLPYTDDEPYEDPRQELVERLLEYQRFKRLSDILAQHQQEAHWIITRTEPRVLPGPVEPDESHELQLSPDDLLAAFKKIVAAIGGEQLTSLYEEFTVNEKIALVYERLALTEAFSFLELVRGGSALEIICAFWAVLELAKSQTIAVVQRQQFASITVERRGAVSMAAVENGV